MSSSTQTCKNCGNSFTGRYCNKCGEKVYTNHDKSIRHIFEEILHFLTHFEGSFLTTLKTILTKPGKLSQDYCNGIRKKYFKPISFFLLCIVLYLLFPVFHGLNMKMNSYMDRGSYTLSNLAVPMAKKKMNTASITADQLAEKYDAESVKVSKLFLLVLLPLIAVVLSLFFFTRNKYFFDHFIFATELTSMLIVTGFLLFPLLVSLGGLVYKPFSDFFSDRNTLAGITVIILIGTYMIIAIRRFYGQNWLWTIIKGIVFLAIFIWVIMPIYHLLLFMTVLLLI